MNTKFRGMKVVIGCCIHAAVILGFCTCYVGAFSLIPDEYGISFTAVSTCVSLNALAAFLSCMVANTVIQKITFRGAIWFGAIDVIAYGCSMAFLPGFFAPALSFALGGLITGFSAYYLCQAIISNWYIEKRASMFGILMAVGTFGVSGFLSIGGAVFSTFGVRKGYLVLAVGVAAVLLGNSVVFLNKLNPGELGQYPDGKDHAPDAEEPMQTAEAETEVQKTQESEKKGSIYKNPIIWMFLLIATLSGALVSYVYTYATVLFTNGGVEYQIATTLVSAMGVLSGVYTMVSGKLLEKMKVKRYLIFVFAFALLCNVSAILYERTAALLLIGILLLGYMIGYGFCMATTFVIYEVCSPENSLAVNTKCGAMLSVGNIILQPLCGSLMDNIGLGAVFTFTSAVCIVCFLLYMMVLSMVKKRGKV